jgi:hypothetical protein
MHGGPEPTVGCYAMRHHFGLAAAKCSHWRAQSGLTWIADSEDLETRVRVGVVHLNCHISFSTSFVAFTTWSHSIPRILEATLRSSIIKRNEALHIIGEDSEEP